MGKSAFPARWSSLGGNPANQADATINFYRRAHDITAKSFRQYRDGDLGDVVGCSRTAEGDLRNQVGNSPYVEQGKGEDVAYAL